jgi:hypothetical protein
MKKNYFSPVNDVSSKKLLWLEKKSLIDAVDNAVVKKQNIFILFDQIGGS